LLHDGEPAAGAAGRLRLLRDTDDGFAIADADFRLRGGGDLLGTRQSGVPGFRLANPADDDDLLQIAHRDAAVLLDRDPGLVSPRGDAVRLLLRLFDRMNAMLTVLSG
jgi:ATP-dependent DNA helicase RecG